MEEKTVIRKERTIAYYVGGKKDAQETLLFLNGMYVGHTSWIKQQRYRFFCARYKMIFLDYPGMGNSIEKEEMEYSFDDVVLCIKDVLEQEGSRVCNIIGFSIGGIVALWFYHRFSEYVESLILMNTGAGVSAELWGRIRMIMDRLERQEDMFTILKDVYPYHHAEAYLEKVRDIEGRVVHGYVDYNRNNQTLLHFFHAIGTCLDDIEKVPEEITVPTLITGSDQDALFPFFIQEEMSKKIPMSRLCQIHDCGHSSYVEKYAEVNQLIEEFLLSESK